MNVMIFLPEPGGHHLVLYFRHIAREALRRGWDLHLVTTRAALSHPSFPVVAQECGERLQVSLLADAGYPAAQPTAMKLLAFQFRQRRILGRTFAELTRKRETDVVYLESMDRCDKALALLGSPFGGTPFVGMLLGLRFHHRRMGVLSPDSRQNRVYEWLFRRLLRIPSLRSVFTIDEPLANYARDAAFPGAEKVCFVADAANVSSGDSREDARQTLGIRQDDVVVLVYGLLSERKGVMELLRAMEQPGCPPGVVALLAGAREHDVEALLDAELARRLRAAGRLLEVPGFLDDAAEARVLRACDIVWLGYRDFYGMSGVLVQAGAASRPVIACKTGLIGWLTRRYRLGEVVESRDLDQVVEAISRLATEPTLRHGYGANGEEMARRHTPARFAATVCDALEDAVGRRVKISAPRELRSIG